jgi:DNA-binding NarL/FixJ family response regulator
LPGGRRHAHAETAVLIVDLKMPAIDGFKVIRWARRKRAFKKLRIFVLTNSDQPRDLALAKQLRVDGYLVKYPNSSVLQWVMNQALAPRPRRGPPAEPFIATEAPLPGA